MGLEVVEVLGEGCRESTGNLRSAGAAARLPDAAGGAWAAARLPDGGGLSGKI